MSRHLPGQMSRAMANSMPLTFITLSSLDFRRCLIHCFLRSAGIWLKLWRAGRRKVFRKLPNAIYLIGSKSLGLPQLPTMTISRSLTSSCHRSFLHLFYLLAFPHSCRLHAACKATCWLGEFYDLNAIYGANSLWQWKWQWQWQWQPWPVAATAIARQSNGPGHILRIRRLSASLINHSILFSIIWFRAHLS